MRKREGHVDGFGWCLVGCLVALLVVVFGAVVVGAVGAVAGGDGDSIGEGGGLIRGQGFGLFLRTCLVAMGIGVMATVLGVPMARVLMGGMMGGRMRWVWAVALVPFCLPSYAMYGAMNLARAPDTVVGGWLVEYATSDADGGRRWVAVWAGYAIGIVGLSLWGSVISSVVVASSASVRGVHSDMMDLEPAGAWMRARVWVGLHWGALVRGWGVVTLVMMGSAVPLHLAQVETWSIGVWRALSERGADSWGAVWVLGLPMVLVGILGGWWVTSVVVRGATSRGMVGMGVESGSESSCVGRMGLLVAGIVWGAAVLVPMAVLGVSIDDWRSLGLFWSERWGAISHSVFIGVVVGLIGAWFAMGVAYGLGHPSRWVRGVGVAGVFASVVGVLVPGVLVGAAVVQVGGWLNGGMGNVLEVIGLSVRVLVIGGVVGAVVAGRERGEYVSQRWSMGGGFGVWWKAHGGTMIWAYLGAGVLCGLLAVHEIEASVFITRAGVSTLSQGLLADLHYARLERLSAALLNLMIAACVMALIGGWLLSRSAAGGNQVRGGR